MSDSVVDLYCRREKEAEADEFSPSDHKYRPQAALAEEKLLLSDIGKTFNKNLDDEDVGADLTSQLVEVGEQFHTSLDVQGYKCVSS